MPLLVNHTPFGADFATLPDAAGRPWTVVVLKAAFEAPNGGPIRPADEQTAPLDADVHRGEPGQSSVLRESDWALEKPEVDVLAIAQAHAPGGRAADRLPVRLAVGSLRKELLVSGDRLWEGGLLTGRRPSAPKPFRTMPLVWERAFGGQDLLSKDPGRRACDPRNPVGVGFKGMPSVDTSILTLLPNVEYPDQAIESAADTPVPAGLGVVARSWQPRRALAGTYDAEWLEKRWPLLPPDFDVRHFQAAPADQRLPELRGGEPVETLHLTPDGRWSFTLPALDVPVHLLYQGGRGATATLRVDTLLLEPDARRFTLTARTRIPVERGRAPLGEIILGRIRRSWWRARTTGKRHRDPLGVGAAFPKARHFTSS